MCASLYPELIAAARHCIIECDPRLVALLQRSFPEATVLGTRPGEDGTLSGFDCWTLLGDPPQFLRNQPQQFPRHPGYLRADEARLSAWRQRFNQQFAGRPVIG